MARLRVFCRVRRAARADPLAVHAVQGATHLSPYQGQVVNVGPAIVTAVRSNGFYMQDETPLPAAVVLGQVPGSAALHCK